MISEEIGRDTKYLCFEGQRIVSVSNRRIMLMPSVIVRRVRWNDILDKPTTFPGDWNTIINKPLTYPPEVHTHTVIPNNLEIDGELWLHDPNEQNQGAALTQWGDGGVRLWGDLTLDVIYWNLGGNPIVTARLDASGVTGSRLWHLPDANGTIALVGDIGEPSALSFSAPLSRTGNVVSLTAVPDSLIQSAATWNAKQNALGAGSAGQYLANGPAWATLNTSAVAESTNLYYTDARWQTAWGLKSTANLPENTNLYYTQSRFDTAFGAKSTTNLTEGTNLYYTQARFDTAFSGKSTTNLTEGTNLYYTDARARAALSGGNSISYNSATGVIDAIQDIRSIASPTFGGLTLNGAANFGANTLTVGAINASGNITSTASTGVNYVMAPFGIGTASPARLLDVNGTARFSGPMYGANQFSFYTDASGAQVGSFAGLLLGGSYDTTPIANQIRTSANQSLDIDARGSGNLTFSTADAAKMTILNGGNVGIGTTTPNTQLHLDNASNVGPQITLSASTGGTPGIIFRPYQTSAQWSNPAQASITATDNNYSANIHFYTKTPGAIANALVERMTIQNDGNVGIGTNDPLGYKLYINGTQYVNGAATFASTIAVGTGTSSVAGTWGSPTYASGFGGSGWRFDSSNAFGEVQDFSVRGRMRVYELLINQIRATNGSLLVSSTGKIATVAGGPTYTLDTDANTNHGFAVGDIIRAKRFTGSGVYDSWLQVQSVPSLTEFTATVLSGDAPAVGYEYVRMGSVSDATRQGLIYLTSDDSYAPYIDIKDGVSSVTLFNDASTTKMRIGRLNGITSPTFGALSGYGAWAGNFYAEGNVYVSGYITIVGGSGYSNLSDKPNTTYIDGSGIYTGTLTATQVNAVAISATSITTGTLDTARLSFTPVASTNVVASINATAEGIRIAGNRITIDGTVSFTSGYDPTTKTTSSDVTTIIGSTVTTSFINALSVTVLGAVTSGSIVVGTTNKMWFNDSADGSLAIGGSTKASAPYSVSATGALVATNATVTGTINATAGTFSGALLVQSTITVGDATHTGVIVSSDWVSGTTGWKIGKGIAEFNGFSVNGATVTGGTIQTAVGTGQRVVMTGTGLSPANQLNFYDTGNINIIKIGDGLYGSMSGIRVFNGVVYLAGTSELMYDRVISGGSGNIDTITDTTFIQSSYTNYYSLRLQPNLTASSTLTNFYGVYSSTLVVLGSSATNAYAGYFSGSSRGTTSYGIYAEAISGSTNWAGYFASGNVLIANTLLFGFGADTNLYRSAANQLATDGLFKLANNVANPTSSSYGLTFGGTTAGTADTNLYRSGANVLKTDGALIIASTANPGLTVGNGSTGYLKVGDALLSKAWGSAWGIGSLTVTGEMNATSLYKLNGTTVIDGSRNLTNIGTISSGAIQGATLKTDIGGLFAQGVWRLGTVRSGTVSFNTGLCLEIEINGAIRKIAMVS